MPSGIFTLKQQELALGQGAWTNQPPVSLNYLVVAGGGGGASGVSGSNQGAGGGAGGLLQGSIPITSGTSYTVTVGGAGSAGSNSDGGSGSNSVFSSITAIGGGGGGRTGAGLSGGSGGGGGGTSGIGGQGTFGQGNRGSNAASSGAGGAGGGAGTVAPSSNGGAGIASDISGIRTAYAGGGGGGNGGSPAFSGGVGGGGSGGISFGVASSTAGGSNTGGGGGGGNSGETVGAAGGSGIVIISYPGTTQWFTGGTLSYANGNVIHTFYSSGTLAPTAASNYINTDYQITRSLRFNSADSAYLNWTPGVAATSSKRLTYSCWVKRSELGTFQHFGLTSAVSGSSRDAIRFTNGNAINVYFNEGSSYDLTTAAVFRDVGAWYHVVVAVDTTQTVSANRVRVYVNSVEQTLSGTQPVQNYDFTGWLVSGKEQNIGRNTAGSLYFGGYETEINCIDGQQLNPYSFGYFNPNTGIWSPLKYVGSYGTNGFYLNFSDNSNTTAATLGKDYSGNGNNWTPNNFSVTAGAGNDSLVDTPTPYGTDTGAGGEVRGNYCTLNPLGNPNGPITTYSNGNLDWSNAASAGNAPKMSVVSTFGLTTGKWYFEQTPGANVNQNVGMSTALDVGSARGANYFRYGSSGSTGSSSGITITGSPASFTTNDVIGIAVDLDAGTATFYKNGSSQATVSGIPSATWFAYIEVASSDSACQGTFNFGQRPFAYTAPSGFKALCTQNLPTPTIGATSTTQADNYFNVVTRTFTAATAIISGLGFSPDWLWFKRRNAAASHSLFDRLRGTNARLLTNGSNAEITTTSAELTSFDSDGFTVGADPGSISINASNGDTGVVWCWRANGAGVSNTAGTITSTVSANTTSGFSVVTYTGNSTASATVGHGLGVTPSMIIVKNRSNASNWPVSHTAYANTSLLYLDSTLALVTTAGTRLQRTSSTVFTVGDGADYALTNQTGNNYVAYCFAAVAGYSAFGSYTGNGSSDGTFVYTGFRPAFVLVKGYTGTNAGSVNWWIFDGKRPGYNVTSNRLAPNVSDAEYSNGTIVDFTSNGFKWRDSSGGWNDSAITYIYAAFAENPFKYSLAR